MCDVAPSHTMESWEQQEFSVAVFDWVLLLALLPFGPELLLVGLGVILLPLLKFVMVY